MHGLHVSPAGSSDNVLIEIPQEMGFVYEYTISQDQPNGLFWLHNHRHEFTSDQTYRGLAAMIIVGNAASNIDQVASIPAANQRVMGMQTQNLASIINPSIPSYLVNPQMDGAAYSVGGVSGTPQQYLQYFQIGNVDKTSPYSDPIPSSAGGIPSSFIQQYTINGLVNPTITVGKGQTEVWSFNNISSVTNFQIRLYDQAGTRADNKLFQISQDGNALVSPLAGNDLIVSPGSRYSFAITAPSTAGQSYTLKANDINSGTKSSSAFPISLLPLPQITLLVLLYRQRSAPALFLPLLPTQHFKIYRPHLLRLIGPLYLVQQLQTPMQADLLQGELETNFKSTENPSLKM